MDLNFSEEQVILRDMVRNLCEEHSTTRIVRNMENDPLGVPAALWSQMKETGLLGMMLPESYGGIGLNMLDRAVIFEEFGRALAPGPYFVSSVMGALAIEKAGSDAQKDALLRPIGAAISSSPRPGWNRTTVLVPRVCSCARRARRMDIA